MLSVSDYWFCLYFLLKFSKKLGHKSIVIVLFTTTVLFIILRKFCMQLKNTFSLKLCHRRAWLSCILASLNFTLRKALKQMLSAGSSIAYFFKDENINRYLLFSIAKEYISFFFSVFLKKKSRRSNQTYSIIPLCPPMPNVIHQLLELTSTSWYVSAHITKNPVKWVPAAVSLRLVLPFLFFFPFSAHSDISIKDHY